MPSTFGLLIIGDEILSGKRADKHMAKVIELLGQRGLGLSYAEYVGDDPRRITAAPWRVPLRLVMWFSPAAASAQRRMTIRATRRLA